jgi:hypothetical protein
MACWRSVHEIAYLEIGLEFHPMLDGHVEE